MRRLWILLLVLACCNSGLLAQRIEIAPYPDAVSISLNGAGQMYLSNADAQTLMEYFNQEFTPDKIIPVKDDYFSGYRLCFNSPNGIPDAGSNQWIEVLTIDEQAALAWFRKSSPEFLALPFEGLKDCVGEHGHRLSDYNKVVDKYRSISGRMYQQTIAPDGTQTDELTASVQMTALKIKNAAESLYVALDYRGPGLSATPGMQKQNSDPWEEWIRCFEEIQTKGYISLIEFNEPEVTPF